MNMVGRIVHAMGGSIKVTSDQKGSGTCITVSVPLERAQGRSNSTGSSSAAVAGSLKGLPVGIVLSEEAGRASTGDRAEQLEITASTLAITSIEKTCKYLGLEARTGSWADASATNVNFILEEEFAMEIGRMQDGSDRNSKNQISPIARIPSVVICKNSPSVESVLESWRNDPHYPGIVTEYIASPCGVRTISRAISSALQRHKEYSESPQAKQRESECRELPTRVKTEYNANDQLSAGNDRITVNGALSASQSAPSGFEVQDALEKNPSSATKSATVHDISIEQEPLSCIDEDQTPSQSTPVSAAAATEGPVLLLVDDNKVNLQLLIGFAKKRKYSYLTADDGQAALDTYTKAHEDSISSMPPIGQPTQRPTVVIMDINMPVMDGYESTQRIRSYEKKHHLRPSTIIAVTALGSAAAHREAFGSGFDLFMTKPVKLKDLTKMIENEAPRDSIN